MIFLKKAQLALAGVTQWFELRPANRNFSWPIGFPVGSHAGAADQDPSQGRGRGKQSMLLSHTVVSLPLFLSHFPSL